MTDSIHRVNVLGVGISAIDMTQAVETIAGWVKAREQNYVCVRDVHGVMRCRRDLELRGIHNRAGMVTPDGMPLVWLCRWAGARNTRRVYGPDLLFAMCQESVRHGWRHYFYGGLPGVADLLASRLVAQFPQLQIAGTYSPPFGDGYAQEDQRRIDAINQARPDILWVGLSSPKQEKWMAAHIGQIHAPVMIGIGAAFDFHAGLKPQAPRWIRHSGFEWLFRLSTEPRRLWKRYLICIPWFLVSLLDQRLRPRRYPLYSHSARADNGD